MKQFNKLILLSIVTFLTGCNQNATTSNSSSSDSTTTSVDSTTTSADSSSSETSTSVSESSSTSISTSESSSSSTSSSTSSFTGGEIDYEAYDGYYKSATGTKDTLLQNLRKITASGYKSLGYDGLYSAYTKTDLNEKGNINDYYSNVTTWSASSMKTCGNYKAEGDCFNREHSIPKSWWGGTTSNQGCDVYIVVPTDGYVNNRRSAYPFGEVKTVEYASKNNYCLLGESSISSYSGTVFEPNDEWKGDFARIYFYALARWNNSENWTSGDGSVIFSGSLSKNCGLTDYALNLFLKWHDQDPVSEYERVKNAEAFKLQKNRNPFVDFPQFVDSIWR